LMCLQRETAKRITAAEIFQTAKALVTGDFSAYPSVEVTKAWENISFACHTIVPRAYPTFLDKYEKAHQLAGNVMNNALEWLADRVPGREHATTVVIFNPLSWDRTDPVRVDISAVPFEHIRVVDEKGHVIPSQVAGEDKLVFIAGDVPSLGYRSYYLVDESGTAKKMERETGKEWVEAFESEHYIITPGEGGVKSIIDKEFNKELLNTAKWYGGEWTSFHTDARGASESIDFEPKPWKYFERMSGHLSGWKCTDSGPVYVTWETSKFAAAHCKTRLRVTLYRRIKRIDFSLFVTDNDGAVNREQRIMFPVNTANPKICYEVPFGVVEAGDSEPFCYIRKGMFSLNSDEIPAHPREVQNWIYAAGNGVGITLGTPVGACAFRDFGPDTETYPVISPVLIANTTGKQGDLIQTGDFRFDFSLKSHETGWENGYKFGIGSQVPLIAVLKRESSIPAVLPSSKSFLAISPGNYMLSTMKKGEGNENIIIRFYETEGVEGDAEIFCNFHVGGACRTDMIEKKNGDLNVVDNQVNVPSGRFSIETIMLSGMSGNQ